MIVQRFIASLTLIVLVGCEQPRVGEEETMSDRTARSIVGTWEMIEWEMKQGLVITRLKADPEPLALTVYTPTHFAYVWRGGPNAGAGTYVFDGATITQKFEYLSDESMVGSIWTFSLTVEGDTMRFSGPLKAVTASGKDITKQMPQLLEVRRRATLELDQ